MSRPKRTILLVEDETSIIEPLAEALRSEGFDTLVAGTVSEALEQARREPDLVLLDVMLPDGSGFDVCRELVAARTCRSSCSPPAARRPIA
jgi:two-component system, OmpR family, response regulator